MARQLWTSVSSSMKQSIVSRIKKEKDISIFAAWCTLNKFLCLSWLLHTFSSFHIPTPIPCPTPFLHRKEECACWKFGDWDGAGVECVRDSVSQLPEAAFPACPVAEGGSGSHQGGERFCRIWSNWNLCITHLNSLSFYLIKEKQKIIFMLFLQIL